MALPSSTQIIDGPRESWDSNGFTSVATYLCNWGDRFDFVSAMRGSGSGSSFVTPNQYKVATQSTYSETPIPYVEVDSIVIEPFIFNPDANTSGGSAVANMPAMRVEGGQQPQAQCTVTYRSVDRSADPNNPSSGGWTNPSNPNMSSVAMDVEVQHSIEVMSVPGRGFIWEGTTTKVAADIHPPIRISITDYRITVYKVQNPPTAAFSSCKGMVNQGSFTIPKINTTCPAETLMFLGAGSRQSWGSASDGMPSPAQDISLIFKQRLIWGQYGWNHLFRPDGAPSFQRTTPLAIQRASFGGLFNF